MTKTINSLLLIIIFTMSGDMTGVGASASSVSIKKTTVLKTETSWDGKKLVYPDSQAEVTALLIEIPPGQETGWHLHPVPTFAMVLAGELEVQLKNGAKKIVRAGEAFAEVVNVLHNGKNAGRKTVKIVVFYAGKVGSVITEEAPVGNPVR